MYSLHEVGPHPDIDTAALSFLSHLKTWLLLHYISVEMECVDSSKPANT